MNNNIEQTHHQSFEDIKHIDKDGNEFWYARALGKLLGYSDFRNFIKVIEKQKKLVSIVIMNFQNISLKSPSS